MSILYRARLRLEWIVKLVKLRLRQLTTSKSRWPSYLLITLVIAGTFGVISVFNDVATDLGRLSPNEASHFQATPTYRHVSVVVNPAVNGMDSQMHGDLRGLVDLMGPENASNVKSLLKKPLDRKVPDARAPRCKRLDFTAGNDSRLVPSIFNSSRQLPKLSVVFIFVNESFEMLFRSVHSVLNRTPPELLEEILLVDDGSEDDHLRPASEGGNGQLEEYAALLPKVRVIRSGDRLGITGARLLGIKNVKAPVFVILDSHIETSPGWAEPLLRAIGDDPQVMIMPQIDGINVRTYEPEPGGIGCTLGMIWKVMEHSFSPHESSLPERKNMLSGDFVGSPFMAGGLFASRKDFFLEIGGYDEGMLAWGAENVEISMRLWQCGGKLLCNECSRVYHMFGGPKHYRAVKSKKGSLSSTTANRMRTIALWMNEYADLPWRVLGRPSFDTIGDVSQMVSLKKKKHCKSFHWFLDNVWPESDVRDLPEDVPYAGPLVNLQHGHCLPKGFRGLDEVLAPKSTSNAACGRFLYFKRGLHWTSEDDDETCAAAVSELTQQVQHLGFDWCTHGGTSNWRWEPVPDDLIAKIKEKHQVAEEELLKFEDRGTTYVTIKHEPSNQCLAFSSDTDRPRALLQPCKATATESVEDLDFNQIWVTGLYTLHKFWEDRRAD